jgi:hypothetical protein
MYGKETFFFLISMEGDLELKEITSGLLSHSKMKNDGLIVKSESNNQNRSTLIGMSSNKQKSQSRSCAKKM